MAYRARIAGLGSGGSMALLGWGVDAAEQTVEPGVEAAAPSCRDVGTFQDVAEARAAAAY